MTMFNQDDFNEFVLTNNLVGFKDPPLVLKSGRVSLWYANWRNVVEDSYRTNQLVDFVLAFTRKLGLEPDCFYGVPEGATKLGLLTQAKWAAQSPSYGSGSHVLPMGRAKPKEHGDPKDRFFVGTPQGKTIVMEDVTTTGGSLLTTLANLQESGIEVIAALGLTNRNERRDDGRTVAEAVASLGVPYFALSNAIDLLPQVFLQQNPGFRIGRAVENYFKQYGSGELNLIERLSLTSQEEEARARLCLPLDGLDSLEALEERVAELGQVVGLFKVGLESYTQFGPLAVQAVQKYGGEVFLDLKLHDIPKTVHGAAYRAAKQGVSMFTVHTLGGVDMMKAAVEGARKGAAEMGYKTPKVLGVTILTSIDQERMNQHMGVPGTVEENVLQLSRRAYEARVDGIVCSAADLQYLKPHLPVGFMKVTPGIQGSDGAVGSDQARVATPQNAIRDGSSVLVVGRAITNKDSSQQRIDAGYEILKDMVLGYRT
ncbi:MAG: orotidine-5'-phosphate decarboxylase [Candidatus Woesearchaeota archaeon]